MLWLKKRSVVCPEIAVWIILAGLSYFSKLSGGVAISHGDFYLLYSAVFHQRISSIPNTSW